MAKKTQQPQPSTPVMTLADITALTADQAADEFAGRYVARTRQFVEMGKLVYHLDSIKLPKGKSVYGILQARGVPESSVNNARLVARFIENFVAPGLVTEARADSIITHRIANQCHRLTTGKSAVTLAPDVLAPILNDGDRAAIGDELDCLDEHGLTIADKAAADKAKAEETERLKVAAAAAAEIAKTAPPATPPAPPSAETKQATATPPAAESTPAPAAQPSTPAPAAKTPAPGTTAPAPSPSSHHTRPDSAADFHKRLADLELASYDLPPEELATVRAKLTEWITLIDSTVEMGKSVEAAAA